MSVTCQQIGTSLTSHQSLVQRKQVGLCLGLERVGSVLIPFVTDDASTRTVFLFLIYSMKFWKRWVGRPLRALDKGVSEWKAKERDQQIKIQIPWDRNNWRERHIMTARIVLIASLYNLPRAHRM